MNKTVKRLCCILMIVIFAVPSVFVVSAANTDTDYVIGNPYEQVDWDTWGAYKTQLHCHTDVSDGANSIAETVEAYYAAGYDILAITDHMTLGVQWDETPELVSIMRLVKKDRTGFREIVPLTSERREEIMAGTDRNGRGMLEVTTGIELNGAVPRNSHLNGFFSDYGQGLIGIDGDYETPAAEVEKRGGITFLDHLGDYTGAYKEGKESESTSDKWVRKFSRIFLDHSACVGTGINSGEDIQTKNDRILYDEILQKTIPYGVVPWSFCFSDSHANSQVDRAFTVHMMPELAVDALRTSMEEGTFFSVSRHARTEIGEDFVGEGPVPTVNRVTVDEKEDRITLIAENYDEIVWVANGEIIAKGASIDLDDYSDSITCYVRAYLTGPGGICYVQPFTVSVPGVELEKEEIRPVYNYSYIIRKVVTFLDKYVFPEDSLIRRGWNFLVSDWGFTV